MAGLLALAPVGAPARATPFEATLSFAIDSAVGSLGAVAFAGSGSGTSAATSLTAQSGIFAGTALVPLAGVASLSSLSIHVSGNQAGNFSRVGKLVGGLRLSGALRLKGNLGGGPTTLASVPLLVTEHFVASTAVFRGAFGWWQEYVYIGAVPWGKYPSSYTYVFGGDERTPGGLGQVTLVSPTRIETSLPGAGSLLIVVGTLTLNFVPEPGTLVLFGAGVAALGLLGRSRMRRRS